MKKEFDINHFPFGKHEGESLTAIVEDEYYCQWLCRQLWFRKYFQPYHELMQQALIDNEPEPIYFYMIHDMKFGNKRDVILYLQTIKKKYIDKPIQGYDLLFLKHLFADYGKYNVEDILEVYVHKFKNGKTGFNVVLLIDFTFHHVFLSAYKAIANLEPYANNGKEMVLFKPIYSQGY